MKVLNKFSIIENGRNLNMLQPRDVTELLGENGFVILRQIAENETHRLNTLAIHHGVGQGVSVVALKPYKGHSSTSKSAYLNSHNPRIVRVTLLDSVGRQIEGSQVFTVVKSPELRKLLGKIAQGIYKSGRN